MATIFTPYTHAHKCFFDGTIDWDTDTIKLALVTSSYTFSAAHTVWADASANEVSSGSGYTTGGATLTTSLTNTKLDANDVAWSALTKTFRGGIVYKSGTANGLTNPLIAYLLFNNAGGGTDIDVPGIDFYVIWNADGIALI